MDAQDHDSDDDEKYGAFNSAHDLQKGLINDVMHNADIMLFSLLRKDRLATLCVILIGDCCKGSRLLNGILKLVMDSHEIPRHISSLFSQSGCGKGTKADWKRFTLRPGLRLLF